jgi:NADH:ubiquinone oxidoreductase subunit 3 (subunit A)
VLTNIVCIIVYQTPWHEVFSQIGFTVLVSIIFYVLVLIGRLLYLAIKKIFSSKK